MDEYDLEEIKREIVESRSLTIKTNNLVNALSADLKSIAKRQQGYERQIFRNNAVAYVVTMLVMFVGLKVAWDARLDAIRAEGKNTVDKLAAAEAELRGLQAAEEQRLRTSQRATDFWELISQNKRRELIESYPEVSKLALTRTERAVFEQAVERSKNELSLLAYQQGLEHVRTGRWHEAQQSLRDSLNYKSDASHSPQATLALARALRGLGRQREAIPMLLTLSEASADREVMDQATYLLAECQVDIQAWNDAKATLRSFLRRFPASALVNDVRLKLATLQASH